MNADILTACERVAAVFGYEAAALKAFVETESGGVAYAVVDGRNEPLIRWEGHYFHKLCSPLVLDRAVAHGLASPRAGGVPNPASQQARWDRLLKPAMQLDMQAALESASWGLGQVMGANWKMLGFASVVEMVELARSGIEGQVQLIARFIEKTGLKGALAAHDWATVARGYNGPAYKVNRYDVKMAAAYQRYRTAGAAAASNSTVRHIQERLNAHGAKLVVDGKRGPKTQAAILTFQAAHNLTADGIVGRFTLAALNEEPKGA